MKGRRMYDDGGRVANTILDQLGGAGRLRAMTGAYNFYDIGNGVSFKIKNARANYIKIKLTSMDLYDVEVGRVRGNTYKVVDSAQGLYSDQLKPFIEKATGMYLSLFGKGGMIEHKTSDGEVLKYKIDEDEMSVEVDYPTMEYLSENGIVMKHESRKLKETYIFWYDQIANASREELEEVLEIELPVHYKDDDDDDYDEYAHGGELTDSAYKKRMKMFGHNPYGKTKGKFTITYNADGEPQSEIWDTLEMAKDSAKRYSRADDFADVKIFDESGKEIQFMAKGGRVYKLGDMWSDDFDYNGMLRMGLKANESWDVKKLRKLFDSYEDVNYHNASKNLWNAIQTLEKAESVKTEEAKEAYKLAAKNYMEAFHDDIFDEMLYRKGGKVKDKWIQDALSGKKGSLRATAKRKGLIRGDEKLSKTDLKKLEKMGGKTAKRAYLAETLREFSHGGDVDDYKRWESRYDMLSELYEDADADERKKIQKEMDELESKMHKSERGYAKGGKVKKKRVRFVDKVESIADRLEGTKVPKRLKKDYGGRYNREEAEEAGRRIAGAQLRDRKMMSDGGVAKEKIRVKSYNIHGQEIASGDVVIDYDNETIQFPSGKIYKVEPDREYTVKFLKTKVKASGGIKGLVHFIKEINVPDSPFNPAYTSLMIEK